MNKQTNPMTEYTLSLTARPTEEGFDILAISEGEAKGHGIFFSAAVLMSALDLYDGLPVFIDHPAPGAGQSLRNLAGTIHTPAWNESEHGIQLKLIPSGPSKQVLEDIQRDAKTNPAIMQAVGFSTVLNVQLNKHSQVTKILRVKSVDVVIDPARGGKFLQEIDEALSRPAINARGVSNQTKGGLTMSRKVKVNVTNAEGVVEEVEGELAEAPSPQQLQMEANSQAAAELLGETQRQAALDAQLQAGRQTLISMCEHLLTTGLATSKLSTLTQARIRKQFEGREFRALELQSAIAEAREEAAALTAGSLVSGPGRIAGMQNSADQFMLAVEDLFGMEREPSKANTKVHQLRGIQEAYLIATGDTGFMGGYYPEFSLVTANFPAIVANVMNKMLIKAWKDYENVYGWWQNVVTIEHFTNLNQVTWVKTGTIASLPSLSERQEYAELAIGDNKETSDWGKYGGYVPLTIEAVLRDDLRAFTRMPREAALAGIRNISEQVANIFTQNSGAGPTMADTGPLFNATPQTTKGGHANLLTTALGTDYAAWNAVSTAMYKKKMLVKSANTFYGTGKPQGIKPSICLVPADLIAQAEALFVPRWAAPNVSVLPAGAESYGGKVLPIAVPEWTDTTDWAAVIDPKLVPGVMIGEIFGIVPQIFSASSDMDPAMFANDESRIKVRQFLNIGVADDMPLHKSNV